GSDGQRAGPPAWRGAGPARPRGRSSRPRRPATRCPAAAGRAEAERTVMGQISPDGGLTMSGDLAQDPGELDSKLAIRGTAGRSPAARSVAQLWRNLADGVPGIRDVTDDELAAAQVPPGMVANPRFVRRSAPVDDVGDFDAAFFGFSPREAEITDPQH